MARRANKARPGDQREAGGPKAVIFPGSFDPLTNGHTDIIQRALSIFGKVIVAVLSNPTKDPLFSTGERIELIRQEFAQYGDRVEVRSFSGLLANFAAEIDCHLVVRGLRAVSDYEYEVQLALMNRSLRGQIETIFLVTREENSYISSTLVRQVASMGGDVSKCVSPQVHAALAEKFKGKKRRKG